MSGFISLSCFAAILLAKVEVGCCYFRRFAGVLKCVAVLTPAEFKAFSAPGLRGFDSECAHEVLIS